MGNYQLALSNHRTDGRSSFDQEILQLFPSGTKIVLSDFTNELRHYNYLPCSGFTDYQHSQSVLLLKLPHSHPYRTHTSDQNPASDLIFKYFVNLFPVDKIDLTKLFIYQSSNKRTETHEITFSGDIETVLQEYKSIKLDENHDYLGSLAKEIKSSKELQEKLHRSVKKGWFKEEKELKDFKFSYALKIENYYSTGRNIAIIPINGQKYKLSTLIGLD